MIELNTSKMRLKPRPYQLASLKRILKTPTYGLFYKMRLGKSKVVIDAACTLFDADEIGVVVVVCPAQVKDVWLDPKIGQIATHGWDVNKFDYDSDFEHHLELFKDFMMNTRTFIVTSYEFLRQEDMYGRFPKVEALKAALAGLRIMLIIDEGCAIGNYKALQTKAVNELRDDCARVVELDGTIYGNSPMCQFSKFFTLDPKILGYKNYFHFRANHEVKGKRKVKVTMKKTGKKILISVGNTFKGQERIDERVKPYCEYLSDDGLDLPKFIPTFLTSNLTQKTWAAYEQMRDEMIADMEAGTLLVNNAAVRALRLAQLCAGFLGGFVDDETQESQTIEIGTETLKTFMTWHAMRLEEDANFKCIVWCRWRPEILRLRDALTARSKSLRVGVVYGDEKCENFMHPQHEWKGTGVMICQPQAAQFGNNYSKADTNVFLSQDYNLITREQSEQRVQEIGARPTTLNVDMLVRGPHGERTIVDDVYATLTNKSQVAQRTVRDWRKALGD